MLAWFDPNAVPTPMPVDADPLVLPVVTGVMVCAFAVLYGLSRLIGWLAGEGSGGPEELQH